MERLIGDADGIDALRQLAQTKREFLKHLIAEARSNSDHTAPFKSEDGTRWLLHLNLQTGQLEVQPGPPKKPA